jgi:TIR domain
MSMMEDFTGPVSLFYSYSHKDERWKDRLETSLTWLRTQGVILDWHDGRIEPGTEWDKAIDEKLKAAKIILLLVSPDFLASAYCRDVEIAHAIERHKAGTARVIPVILRPVDAWELTEFGKLQALPRNGKPVSTWSNKDDAFRNISKDIRTVIEQWRATASGGCIDGATRRMTGPELSALQVPTFHWGGILPIEYFINRASELNDSLRFLLTRQSFLIIGERRAGKTSFGRKLIHTAMSVQSDEGKRMLGVYTDLAGYPFITPNSFLAHTLIRCTGHISREIFKCNYTHLSNEPYNRHPHLEHDHAFGDLYKLHSHLVNRTHKRKDTIPTELRPEEFEEFIEDLVDIIRRKGWSDLFLFYDEANRLPAELSIEFLTWNVEALNRSGITSIYVASPDVAERLDHWSGRDIRIGPFSKKGDMLQLLARYCCHDTSLKDQLPVDARATDRIWELSTGLPYWIERISEESFKSAIEHNGKIVRTQHVNQAHAKLLTSVDGYQTFSESRTRSKE